MTSVSYHEQIAPYGHITLNGVPIWGLVDTGTSMSCLMHSTWWHHRTKWRALCPYHQVIRGANSKSLPIAGHTCYLRLKWGSATGCASFVAIIGLAGTPALISMNLMAHCVCKSMQRAVLPCHSLRRHSRQRRIQPPPPPLPASPPKQ